MRHFHMFVFLVQLWLFTAETFVVLRHAMILCGFIVGQANDSEDVKSVDIVCPV